MTNARERKYQVRRFYDEIWNRIDLTVIPDVLAPDVTIRGSLRAEMRGHEEFADYVRAVTGSLGDYRCDIEDLLAEGNQVVARMMFTGVHRAPLLGVPATRRRVTWAGAAFFTFERLLVRDLWVLGDLHSLSEQLRTR
jgi:predicted ester cyclase